MHSPASGITIVQTAFSKSPAFQTASRSSLFREPSSAGNTDRRGVLRGSRGTSGPAVGIEDAQATVAVIRAGSELQGKMHGFYDLCRLRNCSAIQSMNTRRRGASWRAREYRTWTGNGQGGKSASTSTSAPLADSETTRYRGA